MTNRKALARHIEKVLTTRCITPIATLIAGLLLIATPLRAEEPRLFANGHHEANAWSVSAAYFGEFLSHPGVVVGAERSLGTWGRRPGLDHHGFFAGPHLGAYWHPRNAVGVFLAGNLGYRLVFKHGFLFEAAAGIGYLHTFDDGTVYEVGSAGQVSTVTAAGHPNLIVSGGLGVG